jgi:hypothetical protein
MVNRSKIIEGAEWPLELQLLRTIKEAGGKIPLLTLPPLTTLQVRALPVGLVARARAEVALHGATLEEIVGAAVLQTQHGIITVVLEEAHAEALLVVVGLEEEAVAVAALVVVPVVVLVVVVIPQVAAGEEINPIALRT